MPRSTRSTTPADIGVAAAAWLPFVWEIRAPSALIACAAIAVAGRARRLDAGRLAPVRSSTWPAGRLLPLHVGGLSLLRMLIYGAAANLPLRRSAELPYEYRKDLLGYFVMAGVFWLSAGRPARAGAGGADRPTPQRPSTSATAPHPARRWRDPRGAPAGNYVEFPLADGRRPLMRATLARSRRRWRRTASCAPTAPGWSIRAACAPWLRWAPATSARLGAPGPGLRRFPQALEALRRSG